MCGQESAKKEQQKCASLKELWILDRTLIPFIDNAYPAIHRFMQDNDPKHTSVYAADLMVDKSINCMVEDICRIPRFKHNREPLA